jgi:dihydrofolate reductase/thymidylate synthase
MKVFEGEAGYMQLLDYIVNKNVATPDRTGCGTHKQCGVALHFPDVVEEHPLFTARRVPIRSPIEESLFFFRGHVQTNLLVEKNCNFWKGNTSREFLDNRKLNHLPVGHMGYAYGAVMRHAGGDYLKLDDGSYDPRYIPTGGFDQLAYVIDELKRDLWSRRAMIELWAPQDLSRMALTACVHNYNFCAEMDENGEPVLNLVVKVRSSDTAFGLSANSHQMAFTLKAIAKIVGVRPKALTMVPVDAHIYSGGYANQIPYVKELLTRDVRKGPRLTITKELNTLEDLLAMEYTDILVEDYNPIEELMKTPRPPMAV